MYLIIVKLHIVVRSALVWVHMHLAGVWARVGMVRRVWGCGDMAPPTCTVPYPCPQTRIIRDEGESVKLKKKFSSAPLR